MRAVLLLGIVTILAHQPAATADGGDYEGLWRTTNRKLDGTMTCIVKDHHDGKWTGRFYGVWQGVPFDYAVSFTGKPDQLTGKATIDGADYMWKGDMSTEDGGRFKGTFGGNRYTGYFDLKRKQPSMTASARSPTVR
jgi:hypothetical protein